VTVRRSPYLLLVPGLAATVLCAVVAAGGSPGADPRAWSPAASATTAALATPATLIRVDQDGYLRGTAGPAFVMTTAPAAHARFTLTAGGHRVATGRLGADRGGWNATYKHTYALTVPALRRSGRYRLTVHAPAAAAATVVVRPAAGVFGQMLTDGVAFDQAQRDGAGAADTAAGRRLHRQPSHLNDAHADVYRWPSFDPDSDEITSGPPVKTGATADVAGGWFDAGDYLKFTHTAAFADLVLLSAQRDLGPKAPATLPAEARYGTEWLERMWDPATRTLHLQVGTGNGTDDGALLGDHDLWRRPEADDRDPDPADVLAASHRPVFDAAAPGKPISPNLAGRVAAAFALAAQVDAGPHPVRARREYRAAAAVIGLAATKSPPDPLTTALPNDFYPESSWHDDMELGDAELALAALRLHHSPSGWLTAGAHWAQAYVSDDATGDPDTFNLYDTSALAHTDLARAITAARAGRLSGTRAAVVADLGRQLRGAQRAAARDPFAASGNVDDFDVDAHTFGIVASAGWYHRLTGKTTYDALAGTERGWLLGANAWGRSFMVGLGQAYPRCMQHQVANLSGSLNGKPPLVLGAVVNGPNGAGNFDDGLGGRQDGMRACSSSGPAAFDGHGSRYVDDVRSWQTDEPALDMTATAVAAAAAQWKISR
jgi:endoglucanase